MDENSFSFLITTDNHMGFKEDDHIRRKDSYMAFKEALSIARARDVDFILLGGDLFHMNTPSPSIEHKCIKIIRQHMNAPASRGTTFKRIKGNFSHFHKLEHANFEDANLTVPYPIMTIHGNHDDPTGPNAQSICVKLATCGLLNYFGALKSNVRSIIVEPIILQKKQVKIALYGLGFITDFKLKQAFDKGEVVFLEPPPDTYNILVVHQNRVPYDDNKYIPDNLFPPNFHLIIRGHEHDTQEPQPIPNSEVNGLVYQPGSTIATSILASETCPKKVGLFSIKLNNPRDRSTQFHVDYDLVELKCCRKIVMKDIPQKDIYGYIKEKLGTRVTSADFKNLSKEYVINSIERLLREEVPAVKYQDGDKMARFKLPMIRVRIEYRIRSERFDENEVGAIFHPNRVANKDIVLFRKQRLVQNEGGETINKTFVNCDDNDDPEYDEFECIDLKDEKRDIDLMIEDYFKNKSPEEGLQALSLTDYTNAVRAAQEDGNIISKVLSKKKNEVLLKYNKQCTTPKAVDKYMKQAVVDRWFRDSFKKNLDAILISDDEAENSEELAQEDEEFDDDSMDVVVYG